MKENKFDTVKNGGNKNSIKETIKIIERKIKEAEHYTDITGLYLTLDEELRNALMNILLDYKKVLKENEELKYKVEGQECVIETQAHNEEVYERIFKRLEKENEELKQDKNDNYQMIALAQNEMLGYMQGYEDGKKLNRSAVACVVENQQYYIIKKEIEHYKEYIEKLQKENAKLKEENEHKTEKIENQKSELAILNNKQKDFNKLQNTLNSYRGQFRRQEKEIKRLKSKLDEAGKINYPIIY